MFVLEVYLTTNNILHTKFFVPTDHTNLHESFSMNKMATCSVARITLIQSYSKKGIAFVKIRATEQVAI